MVLTTAKTWINSVDIKVVFRVLREHMTLTRSEWEIRRSSEKSNAIFEFLEQFNISCMCYFSRRCWFFWDRAQNMLIWSLGCSTPLSNRPILFQRWKVTFKNRTEWNVNISFFILIKWASLLLFLPNSWVLGYFEV